MFTAGAQNTRRPCDDGHNIMRIHIIIIILLLFTNLLQVNMRNTSATWNYIIPIAATTRVVKSTDVVSVRPSVSFCTHATPSLYIHERTYYYCVWYVSVSLVPRTVSYTLLTRCCLSVWIYRILSYHTHNRCSRRAISTL